MSATFRCDACGREWTEPPPIFDACHSGGTLHFCGGMCRDWWHKHRANESALTVDRETALEVLARLKLAVEVSQSSVSIRIVPNQTREGWQGNPIVPHFRVGDFLVFDQKASSR